MSDDLIKTIFGRLTLESFPIHEPILIGTFIMVAIGGAAVLGALRRLRDSGKLQDEVRACPWPRPRRAATRDVSS